MLPPNQTNAGHCGARLSKQYAKGYNCTCTVRIHTCRLSKFTANQVPHAGSKLVYNDNLVHLHVQNVWDPRSAVTFDVYFQTLVLPIINYTAAIWGHKKYSSRCKIKLHGKSPALCGSQYRACSMESGCWTANGIPTSGGGYRKIATPKPHIKGKLRSLGGGEDQKHFLPSLYRQQDWNLAKQLRTTCSYVLFCHGCRSKDNATAGLHARLANHFVNYIKF